MIIGFDIDGVLYKWHESVYSYLERWGKKIPEYNKLWTDPYKYIPEKTWDFLADLPILYENIPPEKGLVEYLQKLSEEGHTIYYITARSQSLEDVTERYFRRYKFPQISNLIFSKEKDRYAKLFELDIFVEDSACFATRLNNVCKVILRKQPWNIKIQKEFLCINKVSEINKYL